MSDNNEQSVPATVAADAQVEVKDNQPQGK